MNCKNINILITGASGFIGSHIVERALEAGYNTWAAIRPTSNLHYLQDNRIHFIELDYSNPTILHKQLQEHHTYSAPWDIVIHCAGATKCRSRRDFDLINYEATRTLTETLISLNMVPRQFVFMSSLGSYGPIHEQQPYRPITEDDTPCPDTAYGRSKLKAENYLKSLPGFPYVIFRPTGVYGPRDKDYAILIDSIRHRISLSVGRAPQSITFVYISDLVEAVFLSIEKQVVQRSYFVTDGCVYDSQEFANLASELLGEKRMRHIRIPLWAAHIAATTTDFIGYILRRAFTFNGDKYHILKQRNWTCDITPLVKELGYAPQYDLQRGLTETLSNM